MSDIDSFIKSEIESANIVLFMKGTPVFPQCGFSAATVGVLSHLGVKFRGINVLEDDEIREGIKAYSDWPTIPQLYVKGEFVGGCDIAIEMHISGELIAYWSAKNGLLGCTSALERCLGRRHAATHGAKRTNE